MIPAEMWLLVLFWTCLLAGFGWYYPDCCPGENPCGCIYCKDDYGPWTMKVVLAGIVNGTCTNCGDFNGTFLLDCDTGRLCGWSYFFFDNRCGVTNNTIMLTLTEDLSGHTIATVEIWDLDITWTADLGVDPDCSALSNVSLTLDGTGDGNCDASSSTCALSSA